MNYFLEVWNWLNGKKTTIAMILLFIYGGLAFIGYDFPWLQMIALSLGAGGLLHKGVKMIK